MQSFGGLITEAIREKLKRVAIIPGRFQPPHKGHKKVYDFALDWAEDHDAEAQIVVVTGEDEDPERHPFPIDIQIKMFNTIFDSDMEPIEIVDMFVPEVIDTLKKKHGMEVVAIFAGSDRFDDYTEQVDAFNEDHGTEIEVVEIPRSKKTKDISATKVREALLDDDLNTFIKLTSSKCEEYFEEMKGYLGNGSQNL